MSKIILDYNLLNKLYRRFFWYKKINFRKSSIHVNYKTLTIYDDFYIEFKLSIYYT